jgi:hypothetical protein
MRDRLGLRITNKQEEIAQALLVPPHRVLVKSANNVGKSHLCGALVSWFFDTFDPSICITTAPELRGVKDTCWKETRVQRQRAGLGGLRGEKMPELWDSANHYAKGFTIRHGQDTGFQGRHDLKLFFLFEEACGLHQVLFETTRTMHKPDLGHLWLCVYNPTDATARVRIEEDLCDLEGNPFWKVFELSALEHPNITAELDDQPPPIPAAVTRRQIEDALASWCEEIAPKDAVASDVCWPPMDYCARKGIRPRWFRPGPEFQARILAKWPDSGSGVWSDTLFAACVALKPPPFPLDQLPRVGCDCATGKGADFHSIHARWGGVSLHHETANTMAPNRIAQRLREVCRMMADLVNARRPQGAAPVKPTDIVIILDDDGVGASLKSFLAAEGYMVYAVGAGTRANGTDRYPNKRSELWFSGAERAKAGGICLGLLKKADLQRLKAQLLAPTWKLDGQGRRCVEPKDKTKEKLGRSPDDADSLLLAYNEPPHGGAEAHASPPRPEPGHNDAGPADWRRLQTGGHFGYR